MAHFAKLDQNNVVTEVVVVSNDVATNEETGVSFLRTLYNEPTANWKQTSYNATFRKNFAGVGYTYDSNRDAFISQKPYESWILNEDTCKWQPPVVRPDGSYKWNEETQTWDIKE